MNNLNGTEKKSVGQISIDAQTLIHRLEEQVDQHNYSLIPYAELSALIGREVQNGARGILETAKRSLLRERQKLFVTVRGEGVRMADNDGVIAQVKRRNKSACNSSRRAAKESMAANMTSMSDPQRQQFLGAQSLAGAILLMTRPSSIKKIEASIGDSLSAIPTGKVLEFFRQ